MPLDHPLQTVVHSADPVRALAELDVDELFADAHHHHHAATLIEKAVGSAECRPGDEDEDDAEPAETIHLGHWDLVAEATRPVGEPSSPQIEEGAPVPFDDHPDPLAVDERATTMPPMTAASTSISAVSPGARLSNSPAVHKLDTGHCRNGRAARNVGE